MENDSCLSGDRFDPSTYIKTQLTKGKKSEPDVDKLRSLKSKVAKMSDQAIIDVKQNVFINYQQFIETARDISYLESEIYQLKHLLTEQNETLEQMQSLHVGNRHDTSNCFIEEGPSAAEIEKQRRDFLNISHRIDGIQHLTTRTDRRLLMSGLLREFVQNSDLQTMRNVHMLLCNDSLIVCVQVKMPNLDRTRRNSVSGDRTGDFYRYETMYNLDNVALTENTEKDLDVHIPNLLRLLVFPSQRLFSCENHTSRRQWTKAIDSAKRLMLKEGSMQRQRTIRYSRTILPESLKRVGSNNPASEEDGKELDWLFELPDELDECLAQREFETVVEMIAEGRQALQEVKKPETRNDISEKLQAKERSLVEILSNELRTSSDKTSVIQQGPKATRQAIKLLIKLDKASTACDLYLKQRTAIMKMQIKELRLAEDPLSYHKHLTRIVFGTLTNVANEFSRLFKDHNGCCSVLLIWASGEMRHYIQLLMRHIFEPGPSLPVVGHCVQTLYQNCQNLSALGLEFTFEVESLILPSIEHAVGNAIKSAIDSQKLRNGAADERWRPYNLQSGANLYRFLEEMADLELMLDQYVCEGTSPLDQQHTGITGDHRCSLTVTHSVCVAARVLVTLSRELPSVRVPHHTNLVHLCDTALVELCRQQLNHLKLAMDSIDSMPTTVQKNVIQSSVHFYINQAILLAEKHYASQIEMEYRELRIILERPEMRSLVAAAKKTPDVSADLPASTLDESKFEEIAVV